MKIFVDTNISRNKKDFELSTLPVYTAEEYMDILDKVNSKLNLVHPIFGVINIDFISKQRAPVGQLLHSPGHRPG